MTSIEALEAAVADEIPDLPGWMSLPAVGDALDVTRQRVYQMGLNERKFRTIHKIPGKAPDEPGQRNRPAVYVVRTTEVEEFQAAQQAVIAGHAGDGSLPG